MYVALNYVIFPGLVLEVLTVACGFLYRYGVSV